MIAIIDYGIGNVASVQRSVEECGYKAIITSNTSELFSATHIILPGVGSFAEGMRQLKLRNLLEPLNTIALDNKIPFLGICLGMQLLANSGNENNEYAEGLGWIPGNIEKIPMASQKLPLPHVGWNNIEIKKQDLLFSNIPDNSNFYFVHSYYFNANNTSDHVIATVNYGSDLPIAVKKENIYGLQFHPEKSQKIGLKLLTNFLKL